MHEEANDYPTLNSSITSLKRLLKQAVVVFSIFSIALVFQLLGWIDNFIPIIFVISGIFVVWAEHRQEKGKTSGKSRQHSAQKTLIAFTDAEEHNYRGRSPVVQGSPVPSNEQSQVVSSDTKTQIRRLDSFMAEVLLGQESSRPHPLLRLVERWLTQFGLNSRIESSEVLIEAYLITRSQIYRGLCIENYPAWFNTISFRVIRDYSRKEKHKQSLSNRLINRYTQDESEINEKQDDLRVEKLMNALKTLHQDELEILNLRVVKGLSWGDVRKIWIDRTGRTISLITLRKRGERALHKLRTSFVASDRPVSK